MLESTPTTQGKLAIALSGGGARAMAFHLGCLRALHGTGLLSKVSTISCVSGGSVIGALYCSFPGDFEAFEAKAKEILAEGFMWRCMRIALTSLEGVKALASTTCLALDRSAALVVSAFLKALRVRQPEGRSWLFDSPFRRWASRTTIMRRAFDEVLQARTFRDLRPDRPKLIIVSCELQAKSAFYFAAEGAGSWRYGLADTASITLAHAVAASASYPVFLPALDERMTFTRNGERSTRRVVLTDGGVYDNLGLAPLWPGRDESISLHVDRYDRIIACRAGYELQVGRSGSFWPSRMVQVTESLHERAQNLAMTRLFDLKASGAIKEFLLPYLGQTDGRLKVRPPGLVTREAAAGYPTNFSAMPEMWIERLSRRGEQLTLALMDEYGWRGEASAS